MEEQVVTRSETEQQETASQDLIEMVQPLISFASSLLDTDRLRIVGLLAAGPASRMDLAEATGLSHRELLRQLDMLREAGIIKLEDATIRNPDQYTRFELDRETFRAARQAMGKYKGVKPRPTDSRLMTLETFMPGGKLTLLPKKQEQITTILAEIANKFTPETPYTEREVNVILEDINEDYCTVRRSLVDYGYLSRSGGIYTRNS